LCCDLFLLYAPLCCVFNDSLKIVAISSKVVGAGSTFLEGNGDFEGTVVIGVICVGVMDSVLCYSLAFALASGIATSNDAAYNASGAIELVVDEVVP
jgi:hypothetical protein